MSNVESGAWVRVEPVPPGVPRQVALQHRDHHGERGKDKHVRGNAEVEAGIVEHGAPTENERENAEETEGGFDGIVPAMPIVASTGTGRFWSIC